MKIRKQYCDYCGEYLGEYVRYMGEPESCGKKECNREINHMMREREEEILDMAERDNYSRYR